MNKLIQYLGLSMIIFGFVVVVYCISRMIIIAEKLM